MFIQNFDQLVLVEMVQGFIYAMLAYYLVMHKLESVPIIGRFLKPKKAEPMVELPAPGSELDKMIGGEEE